MYHVYVLQSLKTGKCYVGVTSYGLDKRLAEHNSGSTASTKKFKPFKLVRSEDFKSKTLALKRERFLKSGNGRKVLNNLIK